jgi:hypothetical protein
VICEIYGIDGMDKLLITETRASQAQEPGQAGNGGGGNKAPPRGKEGSLFRERDTDGPIRMVLRK